MTKNKDGKRKRVCVGVFAGAHGVKGHAKIKAYTERPENIVAYGPVETQDGGRRFTLEILGEPKPGLLLVRAPEIASREDAAALSGARLFVDRAALPVPEEDAFYHGDLVGLDAFDEDGATIGRVAAVYNFGAGDLIELGDIPGVKGVRLAAFTKENVPAIDLGAGTIRVRRAALDLGEEAGEPDKDDPRTDADYIDAAMREEDA